MQVMILPKKHSKVKYELCLNCILNIKKKKKKADGVLVCQCFLLLGFDFCPFFLLFYIGT